MSPWISVRRVVGILLLQLTMGPSVACAASELVFGQIASTTHPTSATNARGLVTGAQAYFASVNASGGVNGRQLRLEIRDDGLQAHRMVDLTNRFANDPSIVGLLGYLNSAGLAELAKRKILAKHGIPLIAPLQGDKSVVGAENVFPLRSGYADEVRALLNEARTWGKDSLAIINMKVAFGPPLAELAQQMAGQMGLRITIRSVLDATAEKLPASVDAAVQAIVSAGPKAILLLAAGKPATEFVQALRSAQGGSIQIYGLSVLLHTELVSAVGVDKARGIVLSQAIPYPFTPSKAVITEYQTAMRKHAPAEALSFSSLEGFLGAKIAAEAVRRAGAHPTRERVLAALRGMGEFNLGGVYVNYGPEARKGWGGIELTIINSGGSLQK